MLGGAHFTGAARLSARAAQRVGAGIVALAVPASVWPIYAVSAPASLLVHACDNLEEWRLLTCDERLGSFALGPGAGASAFTQQAVQLALATCVPSVLDADALTAFASNPAQLWESIQGPCVFTPHEGEFARLFSFEGSREARTAQAARESGAVMVLKGSQTLIAAPDGRLLCNHDAPPTLATAGSGDVLTGLIAGLLSQGMPAFEAAAAGVWLHSAAARAFGPGLIADDLPEQLPMVLRELQKI